MHATNTISEAAIERAFSDAESSLADATVRLNGAIKAVRAAQKAARLGDVQALSKGVNAARSALAEVEPALNGAGRALELDYANLMRAGNFAQEVVKLATSQGMQGVRVVYGVIFSFPVVVTPLPDKFAVRLGNKMLRVLRPSMLVAALESARRRKPSATRLIKLLNAIERAYLQIAPDASVAVKIETIYEQLTPLPEHRNDYSEADFVADLYALERSNILESNNHRILSFPASTSARGGKSVIRITTEEGEERLYSSLRFD